MTSVLIVDDEAETRYAIGQVLLSIGCSVVEATDAAQAETWLRDRSFDALVCNLQLSCDGARRLIDLARSGDSAMAVVTTVGEGRSGAAWRIAEARARRVDAILRAPFDSDALVEALEGALELRRNGSASAAPPQPASEQRRAC